MGGVCVLALLAAAPLAGAQRGKGRDPGPSAGRRPAYQRPPTWYPDEGVALLDFDFERHGALHTPSGQLQHRLEPMMEAVGCLLGRIPHRHGGGDTKAVALQIPKTGTRHLQRILDAEYGERQFMTRCSPVPVIHHLPPRGLGIYAEAGEASAPDESCREQAARELQKNEALWRELSAQMSRRGARFITVVREPVAYLLSLFSFRKDFDPENESTLPQLAGFVANVRLSTNMQLGYLSRKRNFGDRCWMGHSPDVTRNDLAAVRQLLDERKMLAGTCEQFESTVRMFAAELGWSKFDPDKYGRWAPHTEGAENKFRNGDVTSKKLRQADLPPETLADIRRVSSLDQELYDDVSRRLRERAPPSTEL